MAAVFRFDALAHAYFLEGVQVPSVTQMLQMTGWVDDTYYTEASRIRGTAVHDLCTAFDLDALDPAECESPYRGWLLAYVAALQALQPTWDAIEIPGVHPRYRFGGRPDRVGKVFKLQTIVEIKSGVAEKAHKIQLALQAILLSAERPLPPEHYQRFVLYVKSTGKFRLERYADTRDFDEARRVIQRCCE
jgi:hypothetical protein